jgi:hypothetical protein
LVVGPGLTPDGPRWITATLGVEVPLPRIGFGGL